MTKYLIGGGKRLCGEVTISGAKNAAVAIIPAALLVEGICRVENIPRINDVTAYFGILESLGAKVRVINNNTVELDCTAVRNRTAGSQARKIRASYYLVGALLGRFGKARVAMPGGCNFGGVRPMDQHIKAFAALGAQVESTGGYLQGETDGQRLRGGHIYFDVVTVGATINAMIAAVLADGVTVIENAAKEPHIVDLANFLNSMGADVKGAGTDVIKVRGVEKLHGGFYSIIPDQIEAGTYMAAVSATGGELVIRNVIPKHLDCISGKLIEMGVEIEELESGDAIRVRRDGPLKRTNVKTLPYPGFPTDMQPQISTCLALADGTSIVAEGVWDTRFKYVDELNRMGAHIMVDGKVAVIEGVEKLRGCPLKAYDLRAGAAMVIAALAAEGSSIIEDVNYIERGYEDIVEKLNAVGADIQRVDFPDGDVASNVG